MPKWAFLPASGRCKPPQQHNGIYPLNFNVETKAGEKGPTQINYRRKRGGRKKKSIGSES